MDNSLKREKRALEFSSYTKFCYVRALRNVIRKTYYMICKILESKIKVLKRKILTTRCFLHEKRLARELRSAVKCQHFQIPNITIDYSNVYSCLLENLLSHFYSLNL